VQIVETRLALIGGVGFRYCRDTRRAFVLCHIRSSDLLLLGINQPVVDLTKGTFMTDYETDIRVLQLYIRLPVLICTDHQAARCWLKWFSFLHFIFMNKNSNIRE
jgi:hypothetical protein